MEKPFTELDAAAVTYIEELGFGVFVNYTSEQAYTNIILHKTPWHAEQIGAWPSAIEALRWATDSRLGDDEAYSIFLDYLYRCDLELYNALTR